jgi:hypothetical protein
MRASQLPAVASALRHVLALAAFVVAAPVSADPLHPWVTESPRLEKNAFFSNLKSGDVVDSPFVVKFGLSGIGIAAVSKPVSHTGHHHLMIDRELPLDFTQPLPFNDQYVHFGKGQMEAVLELPAGKHALRLVFADDKHIPNFVYSDVLNIEVRGPSGRDKASLAEKSVEVLTPKDGARVTAPFLFGMHASGFNISHTDIKDNNTGHFRIKLQTPDGKAELIELADGRTQIWLNPPAGVYSAVVELVSNTAPFPVLGSSTGRRFTVTAR